MAADSNVRRECDRVTGPHSEPTPLANVFAAGKLEAGARSTVVRACDVSLIGQKFLISLIDLLKKTLHLQCEQSVELQSECSILQVMFVAESLRQGL